MSDTTRPADATADRPSTLVDILRWRARTQPDRRAYTFLVDGEQTEAHLTFGELDGWARTIGARLQALGAAGERVMLVCPPGLQYVAGFFGCLYAGAVAVPSYPPRANRTIDTLLAIMRDAQARLVLTTPEMQALVERGIGQTADLLSATIITTEAPSEAIAAGWQDPRSSLETLAFLQYTSGSTGAPKGVMVSHGNLVANMTTGRDAVGMTAESVSVSWLPPFHDLGLMGAVLQPAYTGLLAVLMSPVAFIQRPVRWLQAITRYRGTHSGAPPFAYEYCLRKIGPEQREGLDLRSWRTAYVGAEPIRVETLERFAATFGPHGFRPEALFPGYGLAEATLMVTGGPPVPAPIACAVDAAALEEHRVVTTPRGAPGSRLLAGCGHVLRDMTVVIADPDRRTHARPDEVGEIWLKSPSVARGYWNKPSESAETFGAYLADTGDGPFMRTGDVGFMQDGELYVTGREKDLIIIHGKNHYPQDVEQTAERSHPAARPTGAAAFAVDVDGEGERLVVVQEVEAAYLRDLDADAVLAAIRQAVTEEHDVDAQAVVLVRPGAIPKTSSGKVQRRACRAAYLAGRLSALATWSREVAPPALTPDAATHNTETGHEAEEIQQWLVGRLAEILRVEARAIDVHEPFARYGLSSTEAVGLSGDLEDWLGRRLSPTLIYEYPTIEAVARHLSRSAVDGESDPDRLVNPEEPIAVIGLGCRLPGAASPEALWRLLRDGVDAIGEVPADRWPIDATYDPNPDTPGTTASRFGGFLERVDGFDADFFRIAAREAVAMDPQQRLLLEVTWEALEDAGQAPDRLEGSRTGVYFGMSSADYARLHLNSGDPTAIDAYSGTGVAFSVAVGRISYVLGLHGPNLAVDTSCSSSLVAVHLACQSLRSGESQLALAGGVNMMLSPETSIFLSKAHALAPDGRCKTFDASANGYTRGEGCGVVVLKRLSDAVADGDRVLALIRGSAINHDGRSNGLTAPNGVSQEAVIRAALARAGVEPRDVGYVEAHGTGTALGDPIEVRALAACLGPERPTDRPFALGSIKTNVGHLESAAGVAGLLKAVLALRHGQIPPHLHLREPSPYIPWNELPVVVPTELIPWPAGYQRRIAGVSAFGFSGTNAHVILEEAPSFPSSPHDEPPAADAPLLLPISARHPAALRDLVLAYRDLLGPLGTSAPLRDVCYTASVRRSHHEHRLAVVGHSREELVERLDDFLAGHRPPVSSLSPQADLEALAEAYMAGQTPDWAALYPEGGRCVSLPTYPWQRERFWIDGRSAVSMRLPLSRVRQRGAGGEGSYPRLGPRVDPATQPGTHVWETDLDPEMVAYLRDHRVGGLAVFPAAAFLELALAVAAEALGSGSPHLDAVTISQPLALPDNRVQRLQVVVAADRPGPATFRIFSREAGGVPTLQTSPWRLHAEGLIAVAPDTDASPAHPTPHEIGTRCPAPIDASAHYAAVAQRGLQYGPAFRRLEHVWHGPGEALGRLVVGDLGQNLQDGYQVHPTLLDACFQVLGPLLAGTGSASDDELVLPVGLDRLRIVDRGALTATNGPLWCHAVARPVNGAADVRTGDLFLLDEAGHLLLEASGLRVRHLAGGGPALTSDAGVAASTKHGAPPLRGLPASRPYSVAEPDPGRGEPAARPPDLVRPASPLAHPSELAATLQHAPPNESPPPRQPMADLEGYLTDLVAGIIRRPATRIERDRSLADMGLDSLMAMEIKNRIEGDLGLAVPVTTFLLGPSIAELAAALRSDEPSANGWTAPEVVPVNGAVTAIVPAPTDVDLPLSHGQQALWLTHQLAPRSTAYHIMFAARLRGGVDTQAMARAVQMLVDRHDSLRTTYVVQGGQPVQHIAATMAASFDVLDTAGLTDAKLRELLRADADRSFDLERGPLFRAALFRRSDAEHVLVLTVHHLAVDFWSLEVLVDELRRLYEAVRTGQPSTLPPSRPYLEFVRWQADLLAGPAGESLWQHWRERLAGELPTLSIPTDHPRPRVQTYRGALHDFWLDETLTDRLRVLARAEGATLYATLLAAFSALLARYTGQEDILVGSPMAGRGRAEFERTVGYLVNLLPLRTDLSSQPTFRELLHQARDTVLGALDNQHYPFPLLVERLGVLRDPSRSPLVQVLFIWYRSALLEAPAGTDGDSGPDDLAPDVIAWEQRGAPYDLMLLMTEAHGALPARFQYNADLFEPDTIARLTEHFRRLLESAVAEPDRPVATLPMLTSAERRRLLVECNATQAPYPADACLHELFEAQAARTPDATALVWGTERLTYRQLNRRANRVTRTLQALGIGPDRLVGVCVERTTEMVVGLLGVLKAGGAYLPLDPAYPEGRVTYMIADSGAEVLLTQRSLADAVGGHGAEVVCLDDPLLCGGPDDPGDDVNPASGATPSSLAYVMYTSGSTGRPKGVAVEHHGPVALAAWARDTFTADDLAGVLLSTSICFDLSVFELFAPLSWGGAIILAENILELPRLEAADEVTLVNTVPSGLAEVLRTGGLPPSVRVVSTCGEVLTNATAQEAYRYPSVRRVINLYGPTEDTVYSTGVAVERGAAEEPTIGRPLANKRTYLLDDRLQPVPVGVPGEVYLGGVGLARGYLHRPELTAERFIQNPLPEEPGARLYRVGDLARYRPDGSIEFLGRVDQQVKVRGFRIEPGEIEAVLDRHPAVRESVVVARADRPGNPQLVAYLIPEAPANVAAPPTVSELRRFLQRDLPEYMLPSSCIWLEAMPRTPNGKLDRARLPAPGSERPDLDAEYVPPRTHEEAVLADIWAEVLGVERVGIHDSFFDLGGASLASVTIATKANEAGLPLTAELLFGYPTIAELSALAAGDMTLTPAMSGGEA